MDCVKKIADHGCYKCPCSYIKNKKIHCGRCEYSNVIKTGKVSCMLPRCPYKAKKRGDDWMAHDYARAFYKSSAWQLCRASYIAERQGIDGGKLVRLQRKLRDNLMRVGRPSGGGP